MASVFDVARYILEKTGPLSTMKLQKLVYYSQAWSTVWDDPPDSPLFEESMEAWVNGPVCPVLFESHKGRFKVDETCFPQGDTANLSDNQKETIDAVIEFYGERSAQWLSDLAHREDPWKEARRGLPDTARGSVQITLDSMQEYYGNLEQE